MSSLSTLTDAERAKAEMVVLNDIGDERRRQIIRWGNQQHPDGTDPRFTESADAAKAIADKRAEDGSLTWLDILHEEVLEAFAETDEKALRAELVQVAAVATAWIEHLDQRAGTG